jgi:hypothetical protein
MQRIRFPFVVIAAVVALASVRNYGSAAESTQTLVAGDVTTTMRVTAMGQNDFLIEGVFRRSTYPVGCLSAYRDLRYELRGIDNRIIPVNQQTLEHPPYDGPRTLTHVIKVGKGHPCADNAPQGSWPVAAVFSALYPNLRSGQYTLHITLAPRNMMRHADFAPVPITKAI